MIMATITVKPSLQRSISHKAEESGGRLRNGCRFAIAETDDSGFDQSQLLGS